jgi:hypothetical protein
MTFLGSRHMSDFHKPYCDKKIKQCCAKTIFFSSLCELKILIHGYFSWFWKVKAIFCPNKFCFCQKKIMVLSPYLFMVICFYCNMARENCSCAKSLKQLFFWQSFWRLFWRLFLTAFEEFLMTFCRLFTALRRLFLVCFNAVQSLSHAVQKSDYIF